MGSRGQQKLQSSGMNLVCRQRTQKGKCNYQGSKPTLSFNPGIAE
jgi:hypothetical protein